MSAFSAYTPLRELPLIFGDVETTGRDPEVHELTEVAMIRTTPKLEEVRSFSRKCRPQFIERADPEALGVQRFDWREWDRADPERVALADLQALVDGDTYVFVGHFAHFDLGFLRAAFTKQRLVFPEPRLVIDTAVVAWPLHVKGLLDALSLDRVCSKYGIPNTGHHRAMVDTRRTLALYKKMMGL